MGKKSNYAFFRILLTFFLAASMMMVWQDLGNLLHREHEQAGDKITSFRTASPEETDSNGVTDFENVTVRVWAGDITAQAAENLSAWLQTKVQGEGSELVFSYGDDMDLQQFMNTGGDYDINILISGYEKLRPFSAYFDEWTEAVPAMRDHVSEVLSEQTGILPLGVSVDCLLAIPTSLMPEHGISDWQTLADWKASQSSLTAKTALGIGLSGQTGEQFAYQVFDSCGAITQSGEQGSFNDQSSDALNLIGRLYSDATIDMPYWDGQDSIQALRRGIVAAAVVDSSIFPALSELPEDMTVLALPGQHVCSALGAAIMSRSDSALGQRLLTQFLQASADYAGFLSCDGGRWQPVTIDASVLDWSGYGAQRSVEWAQMLDGIDWRLQAPYSNYDVLARLSASAAKRMILSGDSSGNTYAWLSKQSNE